MFSVKKEVNYGFSFGEEEKDHKNIPLSTYSCNSDKITPDKVNREKTDYHTEEQPPAKKFKKPTFFLFSGHFDCKDCSTEHSTSCRYHNCRVCKQRVGSHNALVCKKCEYASHIACMKLPIIDLCPKTWTCDICSPNKNIPYPLIRPKYTGKVPGILVGSSWIRRIQLTENRLHAPSMAGIHGNSDGLAYSLVSQCGYVKDDDFGNQFYYTGAGGRDTRETHIKDQALLSSNRGLAATCDAILSNDGATAFDWKKSAPIRVIRGYKLKKNAPAIAPEEGFRYDGIYKLFRYWKETESSGFCIWRFHFLRDDDEPAPWTSLGKEYILKNNLQIDRVCAPRNYRRLKDLESELEESQEVNILDSSSPIKKPIKKHEFAPVIAPHKKKLISTALPKKPYSLDNPNIRSEIKSEINSEFKPTELTKYIKTVVKIPFFKGNFFEFFPSIQTLIFKDKCNSMFWTRVSNRIYATHEDFLSDLLDKFTCGICFDMVDENAPLSTRCRHTFCRPCFRASNLKSSLCCPSCKMPIESNPLDDPHNNNKPASRFAPEVNVSLSKILKEIKSTTMHKKLKANIFN